MKGVFGHVFDKKYRFDTEYRADVHQSVDFTRSGSGSEEKQHNSWETWEGRKFYLMQELNRYAEDFVVSSKAYQAVEQTAVWKDTVVDF